MQPEEQVPTPKFAVIVADSPDATNVAELKIAGVDSLMHAFDCIRDTVAADPPWMMISIIRGEDLNKFLHNPQVHPYA